eukprot:6174060-Pleurochrysis_carterae.AAC.1
MALACRHAAISACRRRERGARQCVRMSTASCVRVWRNLCGPLRVWEHSFMCARLSECVKVAMGTSAAIHAYRRARDTRTSSHAQAYKLRTSGLGTCVHASMQLCGHARAGLRGFLKACDHHSALSCPRVRGG